MTRILSKVSSPRRPWRKGVLAFALACLTLWGSMLIAGLLAQRQQGQDQVRDLSGAAWQGIDRVELEGDIDGGKMILNPSQAGRIISPAWAKDGLASLQLRREGKTLIISAKKPAQTEAGSAANSPLRIQTFYLPPQVRSISGRHLDVQVDDQTPLPLPSLQLVGSSILVSGAVDSLRIDLEHFPSASAQPALCDKRAGNQARLNLRLARAQQVDITAPNGSEIALRSTAADATHIGRIRLQTGSASQLELGALALWPKITLIPGPAAQPEAEVGCTNAADNNTPNAEDDYSD